MYVLQIHTHELMALDFFLGHVMEDHCAVAKLKILYWSQSPG